MKPNAHIAFVSPRFAAGATLGGAETLLRKLAEHAAERGCRVTFLATCAENHFTWENSIPAGSKMIGDLEVVYFPVDSNRNTGDFLRAQQAISAGKPVSIEEEKLWMKNSVHSRAMYDHLKKEGEKYDAVITGPYLFGITYAVSRIWPRKTLLVPCLHDEAFAYLQIMRTMFEETAGCLFNSEPEKFLAQKIFGIPEARCRVVGMGMDDFECSPTEFARRHKIDVPYLLYSGRREPLKGTPLLLDYVNAFRLRTGRNIMLVLTGSGDFQRPPEMEGHIFDAGFVSEREKHDAMAGALAFCHPSVNESFGIVLLESWLAGTPGLVHARSEVLKYQCQKSGGGLWFKSYPEFEEELLLLLDNPALREKMGAAGRKYVQETYSWEKVGQRFFEGLDSLVRNI
ncbi:MAG TPA: glycosyltransferase family 4 protein [Kiritimatiellia bacterium]|nr:glycosyltransferase family 4 protein [Kiritimatiellia bacterium]